MHALAKKWGHEMRAVSATLAAVIIGFATQSGATTSLRDFTGPAELPPVDFAGAQYVDSHGCLFLRAGYGGQVNWVPRVSRDGKLMCGYVPTFAASAPLPKTSPATSTNLLTFLFGTGNNQRPATIAATASVVQPAPQAQPAPGLVYTTIGADGRNGPQAVHPADHLNGWGAANGAVTGAGNSAALGHVPLPAGYVSLLDEGKMRGQSGVGTAAGEQQMNLIWTQTVPRRLIDTFTGRDMTGQLPQYSYPASPTASSKSYFPAGSGGGYPSGSTGSGSGGSGGGDEASPANMDSAGLVGELSNIVYTSSGSAGQALGRQFIQVATFGVPTNAARMLAQFDAAGLPALSRKISLKNVDYDVVLLGPFTNETARKSALDAVRNAGFSDAFYVR